VHLVAFVFFFPQTLGFRTNGERLIRSGEQNVPLLKTLWRNAVKFCGSIRTLVPGSKKARVLVEHFREKVLFTVLLLKNSSFDKGLSKKELLRTLPAKAREQSTLQAVLTYHGGSLAKMGSKKKLLKPSKKEMVKLTLTTVQVEQ